jgi:acyl-coenzyme A thioesterase PaaI-like protein
MTPLHDNHDCYVCGKDNPLGLKVEFEVDSETKCIRGRFIPRVEHQGYQGIIHGGIVATLMDEAMVKLAWKLGHPAVSAEITVRFKSPAAPDEELIVTARLRKDSGRLIEADAEVRQGLKVIGEATGRLLKVR